MRIPFLKAVAAALAFAVLATSPAAAQWRHHRDGWVGPGVALGIMGLAMGAMIVANQPPGDPDCWQPRHYRDRWGRLHRRWLRVC